MELVLANGEAPMKTSALNRRRFGFTLIELMIVMAIIAVLMSVAIPIYSRSIVRAKESVLKNNLFTLRTVIDEYTYDKQKAPQTLRRSGQRRVSAAVPIDPMTGNCRFLEAHHGRRQQYGEPDRAGNFRCAQRADGTSLEGTPYSDW